MSADDVVFFTLIAPHRDPVGASRALQLAEAAVLRRAAVALNALPQDYECGPGRADAAERLRRTADGIEEKASAAPAAPEVTPFFQPHRVYAHATYRFRCEYLVTHPTSGRTFAWGWFGKQGAGWRHASFSDRQYAARTWTDVTDTTDGDSQ